MWLLSAQPVPNLHAINSLIEEIPECMTFFSVGDFPGERKKLRELIPLVQDAREIPDTKCAGCLLRERCLLNPGFQWTEGVRCMCEFEQQI